MYGTAGDRVGGGREVPGRASGRRTVEVLKRRAVIEDERFELATGGPVKPFVVRAHAGRLHRAQVAQRGPHMIAEVEKRRGSELGEVRARIVCIPSGCDGGK